MLNPAEIIRMLQEGASNRAIAKAVRASHTAIAKIRRQEGIAPHIKGVPRAAATVEDAWRLHTEPAAGGHVLWRGTFSGTTPRFEYGGRNYSARKIAFRITHGREPVGQVQPECGRDACVAPEHVEDEPGRRRLRGQLAALNGRNLRETCQAGHDQATHGRFLPNGKPYCGRCRRESRQPPARAGP